MIKLPVNLIPRDNQGRCLVLYSSRLSSSSFSSFFQQKRDYKRCGRVCACECRCPQMPEALAFLRLVWTISHRCWESHWVWCKRSTRPYRLNHLSSLYLLLIKKKILTCMWMCVSLPEYMCSLPVQGPGSHRCQIPWDCTGGCCKRLRVAGNQSCVPPEEQRFLTPKLLLQPQSSLVTQGWSHRTVLCFVLFCFSPQTRSSYVIFSC